MPSRCSIPRDTVASQPPARRWKLASDVSCYPCRYFGEKGLHVGIALVIRRRVRVRESGIGNVDGPGRHREPRRAHRRRGPSNDGSPGYTVSLEGKPVLGRSRLGVLRDDADFSAGLTPTANYSKRAAQLQKVDDHYELLTSKRRNSVYRANRRVSNCNPRQARASTSSSRCRTTASRSATCFPETVATRTRSVASLVIQFSRRHACAGCSPSRRRRSGWTNRILRTKNITSETSRWASPRCRAAGGCYPALFRSGDTWLLVSEAGSAPQLLRIATARRAAQPRILHRFPRAAGNQQWRRGRHLNPRCPGSRRGASSSSAVSRRSPNPRSARISPITSRRASRPTASGPGKASWSWPLLGDDNTIVEGAEALHRLRRRDGLAVHTGRFAPWDRQIGYDG